MFVNPFKRAPFVRLLPPLIAGILSQHYFQWPLFALLIILFVVLLAVAGVNYFAPKIRFSLKAGQGPAVFLLIYLLGHLVLYFYDVRHNPQWFGHVLNDSTALVVTVQEPLVEKKASWKAIATVTAQAGAGLMQLHAGTVILYFAKDSGPPAVGYGSRLLVRNKLQRIRGPGNPGAFDYAGYCARANIFHQAYLRTGDWQALPGRGEYVVTKCLLRAKAYCLDVLRKYVKGPAEAGIAQALLIGYREELDKDVVQAYTNTGVVHIIAISGLHLGLIYVSLLWLLKWLPDKKSTGWLKVLIILIVLWGFSIITGASASVLRSAVMFTTIAIGQFLIARHTNSYNTLAASAFLLLSYNPYFIADVGFQLSYLAVLSILVFYKPLYELWDIRNRWADKLWQMVAVSLAAQLLTVPVCLYYFHQFPNLFLPANLIAVPMSTIVLYGEIFLVMFGGLTPVATLLGKAVEWGITLMNGFIEWINRLPFAVTDNLWLNGTEALLLYLIIATMAVWWLMKMKYALVAGIGCWLLLAGVHSYCFWEAQRQRKIIVYNIPAQTAIGVVNGQRQQLLADSLPVSLYGYNVRPAQLLYRMKEGRVEGLFLSGNVIQFYNVRIAMVSHRLNYQRSSHKLKTDYILLSHNPPVTISQLAEQYEFSAVIINASNQARRIQSWKNDCKALTLRCFSVPDEGAFVLNL